MLPSWRRRLLYYGKGKKSTPFLEKFCFSQKGRFSAQLSHFLCFLGRMGHFFAAIFSVALLFCLCNTSYAGKGKMIPVSFKKQRKSRGEIPSAFYNRAIRPLTSFGVKTYFLSQNWQPTSIGLPSWRICSSSCLPRLMRARSTRARVQSQT